jgi:hypothetical protein
MAGLVITTRFWIAPEKGTWKYEEGSQRLGTLGVGDVRSGSVEDAYIFFYLNCLTQYMWAELRWIDIDGRTQRISDSSSTVRYRANGDPC